MNKSVIDAERVRTILRDKGFRVTESRVDLLLRLKALGHPVSAGEILASWQKAPNQATIYRMLTDLSDAGIVKRVMTLSGAAHFEYTPEKPHHHHVICTDCGTVEDIEDCAIDSIEKKITPKLKKFSGVESHSLEFFGKCKECEK